MKFLTALQIFDTYLEMSAYMGQVKNRDLCLFFLLQSYICREVSLSVGVFSPQGMTSKYFSDFPGNIQIE